jgi:hypothetical protein
MSHIGPNIVLGRPKMSHLFPLMSHGLSILMGFFMVDGDVAWFDGERDTWHILEHLVA